MPCSKSVIPPTSPTFYPPVTPHTFSKFIILPFLHMPQCKHHGCTFFSKVAFNISKHESQCHFRHANYQHIGARNPSAAPIVQPCEVSEGSFPSSEGINSVPGDSSSQPRPAVIEDFITFEDHDTRGRSSIEVLVNTIILSLNSISSKARDSITNDLIAVLRDNEFPIDLFRERVKNVSQIKRVSKSILQRQMAHCGFLKIEVNDGSGTFTGIIIWMPWRY